MKWTPYTGDDWQASVRLAPDSWALQVSVLVVVALLLSVTALLTIVVYEDARDRPELIPSAARGLQLALFAIALAAAVFAIVLVEALFEDPQLDVLLVAPHPERRIFWWVWSRVLTTGLLGLLVCVPVWGWLLGRGAEPWVFAAATALVVVAWLGCAALGGVLALAGKWPALLTSATLCAAVIWVDGAWLLAFLRARGPHPLLTALAVLAVGAGVLLAAADVLARLTYTPGRLARLRGGAGRGGAGRRNGRETGELGPPPRFVRTLVRRLDQETHARWRLLQADEHPEASVRRLPLLVGSYALAALVGWALARSLAGRESGLETIADFLALLPLAVPAALGLAILSRPSVPLSQLFSSRLSHRMLQRQLEVGLPVALSEVFPVPVRPYMRLTVASGVGLWTVVMTLLLPFALLVVDDAGVWFGRWLLVWTVGTLIFCLAPHGMVPRIDPRRDPSWTLRKIASAALVLALVGTVLGYVLTAIARDDNYVRIAARTREILAALPPGVLVGGVLAGVVLGQVWAIRATLRRHDERWFDVSL